MSDEPLLKVRDLAVGFQSERSFARAVDGVSFDVRRGRTLGIVGESGCGKSVTALSIMRLLPQPHGKIVAGQILFEGCDIAKATETELHRIRGGRIGMVFQEPLSALNPVQTVGKQLAEILMLHKGLSKRQALAEAVGLLGKVGIPSPEIRIGEYPHQLSGGMRQRVVIAIALSCNPTLLIADEPTTALDVTIQAQILDLLLSLKEQMGMAMILITHDLGVIAQTCDEVVVMYAGRVAEQGSAHSIFRKPSHPYTRGLLASIPRLSTQRKTRLPTIEGAVPGINELPDGCRYFNRCPFAKPACAEARPALETIEEDHWVSCVRWRQIGAEGGQPP